MQKHIALIKKNIVEAVVIGDDSFIEHAKTKYDFVIDVTDRERPEAGDSYYVETNLFVSNSVEIINIPVDTKLAHLNAGTEKNFEPFNISKYSVTYNDGFIQIGCKKYSAPGFLDALHKILIEKNTTAYCFNTSNGPTHGKFPVSWDDVKKLYNALSKVKF